MKVDEDDEDEEDNDELALFSFLGFFGSIASPWHNEPVYKNSISDRDAAALGMGSGTSSVTLLSVLSLNELSPRRRQARKYPDCTASTKPSAMKDVAPSPRPIDTIVSGP